MPAVAGGAYERGIGTMTRNDSEDAVSAREASAGYPLAGVYGLEPAPHADGCHAQYELRARAARGRLPCASRSLRCQLAIARGSNQPSMSAQIERAHARP